MSPLGYIHQDQHCATCTGSQDHRKERAACRYYQTGNCRRGSNCPFAHIPAAAHAESPSIPRPLHHSENMYTYYRLGQPPVYLPLRSPAQPVFLWQPYAPLSPSFDPRYGLVCRTENLPDYPDDTSDPSSESSSTATSLDHPLRMALDTAWSEMRTLRSVAGPPDGDFGSNLSLGHTGCRSHPTFPGIQADRAVGGDRATSGPCLDQDATVALPSPFLLPWQDDPRKKPLAYKTKPCKFFATNGKCTSGEKCTFIHDPKSKGDARTSPSRLTPPNGARLPAKPVDQYDDFHARDYYPITWRVIGGGVMMGGQRQICPAFVAGQCKHGNDCKLAHETELETDDVGCIEPKSERGRRKGRASPRQGTKDTTPKRVLPRKSGKAPAMEPPRPTVFPATPPRPQRPHLPALDTTARKNLKGEQVAVSSAPASPVHRRTQSMCIVTSPPPVVATQSSHAAEL